MKKLPRSFYLRPTLVIARELLGKYLCRRIGRKILIGKIVEVEAYLGERDPASHTYRGKTKRNEVMFREGGHLYVYFTYGMHFCANVVTEEEGVGHAVLLRAVEPVEGVNVMLRMRGRNIGDLKNLTNGPAKLCQAFGMAREANGTDLLGNNIYLTEGESIQKTRITISRRIGIRNAMEKKWRFYIQGNDYVSRK
jgi:DNA-3-methyladenine glycosylase